MIDPDPEQQTAQNGVVREQCTHAVYDACTTTAANTHSSPMRRMAGRAIFQNQEDRFRDAVGANKVVVLTINMDIYVGTRTKMRETSIASSMATCVMARRTAGVDVNLLPTGRETGRATPPTSHRLTILRGGEGNTAGSIFFAEVSGGDRKISMNIRGCYHGLAWNSRVSTANATVHGISAKNSMARAAVLSVANAVVPTMESHRSTP